MRTPTVRCAAATADRPVHLKLENLQPPGSFKLRPIANAMLSRQRAALNAMTTRISQVLTNELTVERAVAFMKKDVDLAIRAASR